MSSLFKTKPGKSTQESTTTKSLPDWLQSAYQGLISQSQGAAGMGMTPEEQQAASYLSGNIGNYQGTFDQGVGSTQSILDKVMAGGPSTADIQAGMNPYLDMILNRQRQEADKSFYSGLSQLQDQEASAGAFGGSRSAVAQETLRNNYNDNLAKLQEQGLYNAFETSRNQYNQNLNTGLGASVNLANLGGAAQQGVMNTATGLAQAGAMPRNIAQGNSSFLNSILSPAAQTMVGQSGTSTTTTQAPQGSMFSQLVGAGLGIAGMASGFGGLGSALGGMLGSAAGTPLSGGLQGPTQGSGLLGLITRAEGGIIPDKAKFNAGGAVKEMPQWLRDDPYLSSTEKMMMWDGMVKEKAFYEQHRPAADREYNLENIPMAAPELDISHEGRMEAAPGVEGDYSDYSIEPQDTTLALLGAVKAPLRVANDPSPSQPLRTKEGKNPFQKYSNENITEAQLAGMMSRNPGLAGKMQELDNMSEDVWMQLFSAPKGLVPRKSNEENDKLFPGISRKGRTDPVKGFPTGGLTPDKMSADEEEMYWRAKQPPSLATILSMRQSNGVPKNALNVYLSGSRPKPMSPEFAAEVERNSESLGRSQLMDDLSSGQRARDEKLVRGVGRVDTALDEMRAFPDTSGKNYLQRGMAYLGALPRQIAGTAGEIVLLPAKGGVRLGELLAQNPDALEAEDQFAALRAQADMDSYERNTLDARNSGKYSTDEIDAAVANHNKAPTEQVREVTSANGKVVPVETAKKPSMSEVEKAVKAQEAKPEEQQGMNIPLIMAGIALMTSKGDPFTSMGEGLAAFLGGKQQIENNKKEAAKQARAEALAERAMLVDEGKLGVMRDQIDVDLRKLALEAKKANKESQYTKSQLIDDYSALFKTIVDNEVLAAQEKGGVADMGALLSRAGDRTMERLYHAQGLTPPAQYVKLTPTQQMAADMKSKPVR